ncbi:MAG: hypothetical protein J5758_01065, partial [Abditibacteriota bacterium]|nr:hypothetical protein [Abditibacteriota bacterium]
ALAFCQTLDSPDRDLLKRSPVIDGVYNEDEWDQFYEAGDIPSGNTDIRVYTNWDSKYLYVAVTASVLSDVAVVLDSTGSGWTSANGAYLFKVMGGESLEAYKAESNTLSEAAVSMMSPVDADSILCESGVTKGRYSVELAIPARTAIRELKAFEPGSEIGFNVAVHTAGSDAPWIMFNPADLSDNTRKCTLVTYKSAILGDLTLDLKLDREIIVPGETLDGKISLSNKSGEPVSISNIVLGGEGSLDAFVNSYKIVVGDIKKKSTFTRAYHTNTAKEMTPGTWVLGAEVFVGETKIGGAMKSFEVVPSVKIEPIAPDPMYSDDKEIRIGVKITNYSRSKTPSGAVTINPPAGWQPKGGKQTISYKVMPLVKKSQNVEFKVIPPLGTFGEVTFLFNVSTPDGIVDVPVIFNVVPAEARPAK